MNIALNCYGPIATGLGTETRWFAKLLQPKRWIVGPHRLGYGDSFDAIGVERVRSDLTDRALDGIDVLVCIERPTERDAPALVREAKRRSIRTVLLTNPEWTVPQGKPSWCELFDLLVARTNMGIDQLNETTWEKIRGGRVRYADLPVALDEFPFTLRESAERAVYVHGWGGVADRKGWPEVQEMLACHDVIQEFTIKSQRNKQNIAAKSADLYADADVLLMPSRWEGLGLPLLEAMASGCLVLATNAPPMSDFLHAAYKYEAQQMLLPVERTSQVTTCQPWTAYHCSPKGMAEAMRRVRSFHPEKVRRLSQAGRDYVERVHGAAAVERLREVICGS